MEFILFLFSQNVCADLNFFAYSFSSLFKISDCVVSGEVIDIKAEHSSVNMTFEIEETHLGNVSGTIVISTPLNNGAYLEDQAYLSTGRQYTLFLEEDNDRWSVSNGIAGVLDIRYSNNINTITSAVKENPVLFLKQNNEDLQSLFFKLDTKEVGLRLLEGMRGNLTIADEQFFRVLLQSETSEYQEFAARQAGLARIESMRKTIEEICQITNNPSLISSCLFALAQYGNPESIPFIAPHLDDLVRQNKRCICRWGNWYG